MQQNTLKQNYLQVLKWKFYFQFPQRILNVKKTIVIQLLLFILANMDKYHSYLMFWRLTTFDTFFLPNNHTTFRNDPMYDSKFVLIKAYN